HWVPPREAASAMEAIGNGTRTGLRMCLQIAAILLVLVSLVHLCNLALAAAPDVGGAPLTLERILGTILRPLAWLLGIPWQESLVAGQLLGTKTILNELLAYLALAELPRGSLGVESELILTYALCGFANIGSLGILIAGLTELVPERREDILLLGPRAVVAGSLATFSTGAVIGLVHI
ncbi:MAG: nucleoside transporter C-terminal domain-containing protein, partial [Gammaproteobacteria bacterium]